VKREPHRTSFSPEGLEPLAPLLEAAISAGDVPGAVIVVGNADGPAYHRAFGWAQVVARRRRMKLDTVFDLASLTKVVATAPAVMILAEAGQLLLSDPVCRYLPAFAERGKETVTIAHLLTHTSGLPAFHDYSDASSAGQVVRGICEARLKTPPGEGMVYSDLGFIVLGEVVRLVSGRRLDQDTTFRPGAAARRRCAATEERDGEVLVGRVHDPNAAAMGGVAGHAGLFSTAADLGAYARMLLNHGRHGKRQILSPLSVETMTGVRAEIAGEKRGYGWDIATAYSSPRGDFLSPASYGHTGFTGTSLWIDPENGVFVILLTNCIHPRAGKKATRLRGLAANVVAASIRA
jgi:CubicO group peptidase (beta-lactamase class C family)